MPSSTAAPEVGPPIVDADVADSSVGLSRLFCAQVEAEVRVAHAILVRDIADGEATQTDIVAAPCDIAGIQTNGSRR